jgi:hypothetical protein
VNEYQIQQLNDEVDELKQLCDKCNDYRNIIIPDRKLDEVRKQL